MNEIHEQVKKSENKELAIENYVKNLSRDFKIIFIDELHIFNICLLYTSPSPRD